MDLSRHIIGAVRHSPYTLEIMAGEVVTMHATGAVTFGPFTADVRCRIAQALTTHDWLRYEVRQPNAPSRLGDMLVIDSRHDPG